MCCCDKPYVIALPESREADKFVALLKEAQESQNIQRKMEILRCPLVSIQDTPQQDKVQKWLDCVIADKLDYVILYSGEGVQALLRFARRGGKYDEFAQALGRVKKITRGSKPIQQLRQLNLKPDLKAVPPTTDGTIATLQKLNLQDKCVGVQLYDKEQNQPLMDCLSAAGAISYVVRPYVYGDDAADSKVNELINKILNGNVNIIAFTSSLQVRRLAKMTKPKSLDAVLKNTKVASIGPMVSKTLAEYGAWPDIYLESGYGLKPFAKKIVVLINNE